MLLGHDPVHAFMPYPPVAVAGSDSGPLASLSFGVKDLFDVKGYRTGCGNPMKLAQSPVASANAPAVQMLLDAGARFVGKTHTEEMAWSLYGTNAHFGTPINPAAPDRVPGGSSSGSASAVAARLCDVALGSDTGGSVRAPASFCGLYGLRPTHGAIPLDACMALAPSFDTCGFFARSADALAAVGPVLIAGSRARASRPLIAGDLFARLPAAAAAALKPAVAKVEALVGKPRSVALYRDDVQEVSDAFRHVQAHEIDQVHGRWAEHYKVIFGPSIAARFAFARSISDDTIAACRATRTAFAARTLDLLSDDGLLILPTLHGPAPLLASTQEQFDAYRQEAMVFLQVAGMAGLPQLVIPAGTLDGAPYGLSLVGPRGADHALLELAVKLSEGER